MRRGTIHSDVFSDMQYALICKVMAAMYENALHRNVPEFVCET